MKSAILAVPLLLTLTTTTATGSVSWVTLANDNWAVIYDDGFPLPETSLDRSQKLSGSNSLKVTSQFGEASFVLQPDKEVACNTINTSQYSLQFAYKACGVPNPPGLTSPGSLALTIALMDGPIVDGRGTILQNLSASLFGDAHWHRVSVSLGSWLPYVLPPGAAIEGLHFETGLTGWGNTVTVNLDDIKLVSSRYLLGDFNEDHHVDDADYTVWADNFGRVPDPKYLRGSGPSGSYNDGDYTIWADNFCFDDYVYPMPEPATLSLLGLGLFHLCRRRRQTLRFED